MSLNKVGRCFLRIDLPCGWQEPHHWSRHPLLPRVCLSRSWSQKGRARHGTPNTPMENTGILTSYSTTWLTLSPPEGFLINLPKIWPWISADRTSPEQHHSAEAWLHMHICLAVSVGRKARDGRVAQIRVLDYFYRTSACQTEWSVEEWEACRKFFFRGWISTFIKSAQVKHMRTQLKKKIWVSKATS